MSRVHCSPVSISERVCVVLYLSSMHTWIIIGRHWVQLGTFEGRRQDWHRYPGFWMLGCPSLFTVVRLNENKPLEWSTHILPWAACYWSDFVSGLIRTKWEKIWRAHFWAVLIRFLKKYYTILVAGVVNLFFVPLIWIFHLEMWI